MARLTNDGEPTYGSESNDQADSKTEDAEIRPPHHFSGIPVGQPSPEGDEPPLVRVRLSEDGSHIIEETLSPNGGVLSRRMRP